jgi:hypothetical protein
MNQLTSRLGWAALSLVGAGALGFVALHRGESINAVWIVMAAVCVYLIAYRFYSLYISTKVLGLDPKRQTPAYRHNDGLDFVPTNRFVLFGHHFAAIAGAGPLVGPVLAAGHDVDPGRRRVRRRGTGLHRAVHVDAPRRPLAGRPDQIRDG